MCRALPELLGGSTSLDNMAVQGVLIMRTWIILRLRISVIYNIGHITCSSLYWIYPESLVLVLIIHFHLCSPFMLRLCPRTSTVTLTPPSLMPALASHSTTTSSSWFHGELNVCSRVNSLTSLSLCDFRGEKRSPAELKWDYISEMQQFGYLYFWLYTWIYLENDQHMDKTDAWRIEFMILFHIKLSKWDGG